MQGDGFVVEPVVSVSDSSQVGRGTPRVYGVLFKIFDDITDGIFYMLKTACCFPFLLKRSVSVNTTRDTRDLADLNSDNNIEVKEKPNDRKISFAATQESPSSIATTVISRCSVSDSSSWRSSLRHLEKNQDNFDFGTHGSLKSKAGIIRSFFSKQKMLKRKGALKKCVPQLRLRRRRRSNSVVRPSFSSETMSSKSKCKKIKRLFPHQLAREMTLGPEAYPCLQKEKSPSPSMTKPMKSIFERKLKRTFSYFNDIYS